MGILKCTIVTAFAVLLQTTDAVIGPWNTASNWPSGSPWWDSIVVDIDSSFVLQSPWSDPGYAAPDCFNADIDPITGMGSQLPSTFNAQRDCPLCDGKTDSTPGFAADPANCAMYYICDKVGSFWNAYHMPCPACTFWSQIDLTCVQVDDVCPIPTFQDGPTRFIPALPKKLITCLTFNDSMVGNNGIWVLNQGVHIVPDLPAGKCVYGSCAYFDGSARLEVPRFSNSWSGYSQFAISVFIKKQAVQNLQGIISNDCFGNVPMEPGNSVYLTADSTSVEAGMKAPGGAAVDINTPVPDNTWVYIVASWDGQKFTMYENGALVQEINFDGPIRRSPEHCPMVIGSFILNRAISYFTGYLDEVCFFKAGLSSVEVSDIYANPDAAYHL